MPFQGKQNNKSLPIQKIIDASGGNNSLREVLQQIAAAQQATQQVTNTASKNTPPQASGQVSYLNPNYVVQITLPGAIAPTSVLQAAQIAQNQTPTANVTAIYHQIQAANSPSFSESSNVTLFGGTTGSTQTYWTIANLAAGQWYFRFRSSYDGINWNQWKNANGGRALNGTAESVTVEQVTNCVAAVFQLPGSETVAFVSGLVSDQGSFSLPEYLFTGSMASTVAPNGFKNTGHPAHGFVCSLGYAGTLPPSAVSAYPPLITMEYSDNSGNTWPGSANIFAFAWNPLGTNQSVFQTPYGNWAIFTLSGGAQIAIGSGVIPNGGTIAFPSGFSSAAWIPVVSPNTGFSAGNDAHGVTCTLAGATVTSQFADGSGDTWPCTANWFAVAFSQGLTVETVSGNLFLVISTPGGSKVAIGSGTTSSGSLFALPAGFTFANSLVFAAPSTFVMTGNQMSGIAICGADDGYCQLTYNDGSGDTWGGTIGWFCFAWQ
jgi:hypothetical protein